MSNKQYNPGRKSGVALFIASIFLIAAVFLPWVSFGFSWSSTAGERGGINYSVNGLGFADGFADIVYNRTSYYHVKESFGGFIPQVTPFGVSVLAIAVFNILFAMNYIDPRTRELLPKVLRNQFDQHHSRIMLMEILIPFIALVTFTLYYFNIPVKNTLYKLNKLGLGGENAQFNSGNPSLFEFYRNVWNYVDLVSTSNWSITRNLTPGMGYLLAWIGVFFISYTWYVNLYQREDWPQVWRKRTILSPLLILLAFLPVTIILTRSGGLLPPLLLAGYKGFLSGYIVYFGPLYFILTVAFFYFSRETALIEKNVSEKVRELYAKEEIEKETLEERLDEINVLRGKSDRWRLIIGILSFLIFLIAEGVTASLLGNYIQGPAYTEGASFSWAGQMIKGAASMELMAHTLWNWLLLICPIGTIILIILYHR